MTKTKPFQFPKETRPLRVWWIPQVPGCPFEVTVNSLAEAALLLKTLAAYDQFQFLNHIKPDYSNAGGLEVKAEDDWEEWCNDDGESIDEVLCKS